nr:RcpC/CpaB family pilus assembly protein [Arthrobacter silviterrae]
MALVLAIAGVVLLATYVQAADRRAQAGMNPMQVLVVQQPVAAGTTIDELKTMVKSQSLPKAAVAQGAVTSLSDQTGKVTAVALVPGEQLLAARLVAPSSLNSPDHVDVPKGLEELTLKLDPERVLGGEIKAGDTVGVFISYNTGVAPGTSDSPATKLQFHKVLVTKVGMATSSTQQSSGATAQAQSPNSGTSIFITIAQTGADATATVHAAEFGKIYLSKENANTNTADVPTMHKDGVLK